MPENTYALPFKKVETIKALRVQTDALIQAITNTPNDSDGPDSGTPIKSQELYHMAEYQALRAATEAKMWLGKMLEGLNNPFPAELADKANVQ